MRAFQITLASCLLVTGLWAAESVSGTWTAEVQERHGDITAVTMDLMQDEGVLTGTVRGSGGEEFISTGTVDGDEISFYVVTVLNGNQLRQHYRGILDGDLIHFSLTVENERFEVSPVREFDAVRAE